MTIGKIDKLGILNTSLTQCLLNSLIKKTLLTQTSGI